VNIFKINYYLILLFLSLALINCSSEFHYSGLNENKYNKIYENYNSINYSKDEIEKIFGPPMVKEDSGDLWIYRIKKEKGNYTIKKVIFNKTIKLKFNNNILESIEEVSLN
tara:strand:+ start:237 stop:569 length:333 start_codon:yes stop_codon:yes gene_type:complete